MGATEPIRSFINQNKPFDYEKDNNYRYKPEILWRSARRSVEVVSCKKFYICLVEHVDRDNRECHYDKEFRKQNYEQIFESHTILMKLVEP